MSWRVWSDFVLACTVMGLIPGPGVTSICGYHRHQPCAGGFRSLPLASPPRRGALVQARERRRARRRRCGDGRDEELSGH